MKRLLLELWAAIFTDTVVITISGCMKKLKVTITIVKNGIHGYICECDYPFGHFDLGGSGFTVEEAKADCFTFYNEMKKEYPNESFPESEVSWVYDFPSFFNNFDFLNIP